LTKQSIHIYFQIVILIIYIFCDILNLHLPMQLLINEYRLFMVFQLGFDGLAHANFPMHNIEKLYFIIRKFTQFVKDIFILNVKSSFYKETS
jgi:hypothetical protein